MDDRFTLSFRPDIDLSVEAKQIVLRSPQHSLTLEQTQPGLKTALEHLKYANFTLLQLTAVVAELDGADAAIEFTTELQKLIHLGWICHSVLPFATAIPIAENYQLRSLATSWQTQPLLLSRFAYLHQENQQFVLESPRSKSKILLLDWRVAGLIAKLAQSHQEFSIDDFVDIQLDADVVQLLLHLLIATEMIDVEPEDSTVAQWKFHNLLFHRRTRLDRLDDSRKSKLPVFEERDRYPIVKPPMSDQVIPLEKPDLTTLAQSDMTLTQAIESRQSIREYGEHPITVQQLGEFLYRTARVKEVYTLEEDPMQIGECTKRPYPAGGALYELEIYPVISQCDGLAAGLYHYQPLSHALYHLSDLNPNVEALVYDAWKATGQQDIPQILFIITARFGRLYWKYHDIAYGLILKHIGVLYQTFYLVATAMHLAPSAIGAGNSEQFCQVAGLNEYEESSVGEFSLGSLKVES
jgi:SagB-type dehydrogenase family enzyme